MLGGGAVGPDDHGGLFKPNLYDSTTIDSESSNYVSVAGNNQNLNTDVSEKQVPFWNIQNY